MVRDTTSCSPIDILQNCSHLLTIAKKLPPPIVQKVGRDTSAFVYEANSLIGGYPLRITVELHRDHRDLRLMYRTIRAKTSLPSGTEIGSCDFYTCRRSRSRGWMSLEGIYFELDLISDVVSELTGTLSGLDADQLFYGFNRSILIAADRVEVDPSYRGTSLWKEMFALCLRHSLEDRIPVPAFGYLKAFPLEFENNVKGNETAFARSVRRLRLLYAMGMGARTMEEDHSNGCYMAFPIGAPPRAFTESPQNGIQYAVK